MAVNNFGDILGLGTPELVIILVILVLLFGATKLPQLSKSIGTSIKELRKGMQSEGGDETAEGTSKARKES